MSISKTLKSTFYLSLIIAMTLLTPSCNSDNDLNLVGQWRYLKSPERELVAPLKSFCPTSYPEHYPCEEIVYFTTDKIEHPLMSSDYSFKLEDKFISYKIQGDSIKLFNDSLTFNYKYKYSDNKLCLDKQRFCLEKINQEANVIDSTIFYFKVIQEDFPSYSLRLNHYYLQNKSTCELQYDVNCQSGEAVKIELSDEEVNYILKLLERIPEKDLNRIYNNGLSDCREISIDFYTSQGFWKGIETCDLTKENPFEIRAFTTNMFWILQKYLVAAQK